MFPDGEREIFEDYSLSEVPKGKREHWLNIALVWVGVAIVMSALLRGMMVGMGLGSIPAVLLAYVLGELILIVMMALTGYIGAKSGLSTPLIARHSFGEVGSYIISLSIALSLIGWFGVQAALFAETVITYTSLPISIPLASFLGGVLMMLPAIIGFKGLKALSLVAVPLMLLIFIYATIKTGGNHLPKEMLIKLAEAHKPSPYPITIGGAASIVAGGFIVGSVTAADIARYARPRLRDIFYAASTAMAASAFLHFVGSLLSMSSGVYHEHLPKLVISPHYLGLGLVGFITLLLAQWTTNDNNIYSAVLALNNILRLKQWKLTIAAGLLASILAAAGILKRLAFFLTLLTIGIGPIGGIIVTDFYLLGRKLTPGEKGRYSTRWKPEAVIAYFIAFTIGWLTSGHPFQPKVFPFSVFAFNSIISAMIVYYLLTKIIRREE
jgi:cytosine permease